MSSGSTQIRTPASSPPRNGPIRHLIRLGVIAALVLCAAAGAAVFGLRVHDIDEAKRELSTLDLLLVEDSERAMQSVDLVLKSVQQHIAAEGVVSAEGLEATQTGLDTHELLKSKLAGVPQIDGLTIVAADGRILNLSKVFPVPAVNLADRDYFIALRDNPVDVALLTKPVRSRVTGRDVMFLARRLTSPTGEFIGVVLGTIDQSYLTNRYKALRAGVGVSVSLWHKDGILLARFPPLRAGQETDPPPFQHVPDEGDPLVYEERGSGGEPPRIAAAMSARQFPLAVVISKSFGQVLSEWRRKALFIAFASVVSIAALGIGIWLLARQFATYEELKVAIAERGEAVAAREEAEAQLRQAQKLEAIGQLTGGIAHDFNNLLTAVLGNLELLQRHSASEDPKIQRWTKNAIDAARRGAALTKRLLAFSRRQPLEPRRADVGTLLGSMSDLLTRTLGDSVEVVTSVAPGLWKPFVDPSGLDNAILNIALNARDAMEGRGRLSIEASNYTSPDTLDRNRPDSPRGDYVRIAISDTGRGIAKDVLERVFEPFYTTKPVGQGTGLGLSQVYGFITQSGGQIRLSSEIGKGTTVEMFLPRAPNEAEAEATQTPSAAVEDDDVAEARQRGAILVVENDDTVRAYAVEALRDLGFGVIEAADASAALAALRAGAPIVLLFTDVGLPGMNGHELAEEALRLRPDLHVLFMTGYARDGFADGAGADAPHHAGNLIAKPFSRADLLQKLQMILARRVPDQPDIAARA